MYSIYWQITDWQIELYFKYNQPHPGAFLSPSTTRMFVFTDLVEEMQSNLNSEVTKISRDEEDRQIVFCKIEIMTLNNQTEEIFLVLGTITSPFVVAFFKVS